MKLTLSGWKPSFLNSLRQDLRKLPPRKIIPTVFLLVVLAITTMTGFSLFLENRELKAKLARLETDGQFEDLCTLKLSNEWLKNRVAVLQEERALLLDTAVADLDEKSRIVESILNSVGVDIEVELSRENSGGPFISGAEAAGDELILRTDRYLDAMQNLPLGAPVPGVITSRFGWRDDPFNGKSAYHRGVDIRGEKGTDVKATANGKVKVVNFSKGDGRYVMIDHGNGFVTKYAHLDMSLVNDGDQVVRGQVIGLVGSTGRSTGPHVHYEIHYNDKIVNPSRFVRIARYLEKLQSG